MKKVLLSLGLVAGLSYAAQAQGIKYGVKAGASLTNVVGDDAGSDNSYKFGFNGGVLVNFGINDMFSIQPEVLYSMKGAKVSGGDDARVNLNYIDVPVMVRVATGSTGLFFEAGPQVGFLASANAKSGGSSLDVKDTFKSVDFGYAAGLGFQTESGAMVGLRYNGAFTNIPKEINFGGQSIQAKVRNSAFQLYVGYMFGGK